MNPQTSSHTQNRDKSQQPPQDGGGASQSGSDVDLEMGHSNGGILKETSLRVTEMRKSRSDLESGNDRTIGDYYLVEQARRSAEADARDRKPLPNVITKKSKRSSISFSRIRRA